MKDLQTRIYTISPDRLFPELLKLVKTKFKIKKIEDEHRLVEISSGMSLFSFGESFEIIVSDHDQGSIVRVKGESNLKWNVSSNVKEKISEIFELLDCTS